MPGSGATRSAWMDGVPLIPKDGPMLGDTQADVCIIGAGLAGLTTGYLLAREGRSVIIVDDGVPGMGETLRTTAHLTAAIDDRIHVLERRIGVRKTRLAVESQVAAIDRIERICADEHLTGVFRRVDGHLFLHPDDQRSTLEAELEAARRAGLEDVRLEETTPLPFQAGPCLVFPRQAEVDAGQYIAGLADAIARMGGRIHASTHATNVEEGEGGHLTVTTTKGRIECEAAVVCTNAPVFGKVALHTKQDQYRTYVVAYEVPAGQVPPGLYWDTWGESGYHYIRLAQLGDGGRELLLVGGEDHRVGEGDPAESLARLEDWAAIRFNVSRPAYRWSGQVIEPADRLPFLGRYPGKGKNVYVITGDSGQGFTNHTAGAMLVTDLIQGRRNPWQGLYSPSRQGIGGLLRRIQAVTAGGKETAKGKLGIGEVEDERSIRPGSGAVVTRDGQKVACYREPSGELRECAAACTHMGAIVRWNTVEKTWDCPWHGSRFKATGQVINGPANTALDPPEPAREEHGEARNPERKAGRPAPRVAHTPHQGRPAPRRRAPTHKPAGRTLHGPDAIALLKEDHRKVKRLLKQLDAAGDGAERRGLFDEVERELLAHARLEEELFYPRFKEAVGDDDEETRRYFEAHEEHEVAERVAAEIRAHRDPSSPEYAAKCKVLKDLVEHHIEEEEKDMFPTARTAIGREDLLHLGDDMRQRRHEMLAGGVQALRRIAAPADAIEPGRERRDRGHGERADGAAWKRMQKHEDP